MQWEDRKMDQKSSLGPELEGTANSGPLRSPATGMARSKSISALDALAEIQAAADRVLEAKSPKAHASGDGQGKAGRASTMRDSSASALQVHGSAQRPPSKSMLGVRGAYTASDGYVHSLSCALE